MKTPFTTEEFFNVFLNYNETVFPIQILFYLLGIFTIYLTFNKSRRSDRIISGILSFFWLWMGIVYHLFFFTSINKAAWLFGVVFILQGILFLNAGVIKSQLSFKLKPDVFGITGIFLLLFALIFYPALGHLMNHNYPASPTFGLPCPTTIFTFGILLLSDKKCPVKIIVIPVVWSLIGFTAAFQFGVKEDTGLLIAGILSLILLSIKNKKFNAT